MSVDRTGVNGADWRANTFAPLDQMGSLGRRCTRFAPDRDVRNAGCLAEGFKVDAVMDASGDPSELA